MSGDCPYCAGETRTVIFVPINSREWEGVMPRGSFEALSAANLASETNASDRGVWRVALMSLYHRSPSTAWLGRFGREYGAAEHVEPRSHVLPTHNGDRPKGRTNGAGDIEPYPREVQTIDALTKALWRREHAVESELSRIDPKPTWQVRLTHRAIHEALTGESTKGCKWCEGVGR